MAWFDELDLPGATITGRFAFIREDGPDEDESPDVVLAAGAVTLTPTASAVKVDGAWVGISAVRGQIFEGEIVVSESDPRPLRILSTDVETDVRGWGWRASFDVSGARILPTVPFLAPANGVVNLTGDLIPVTGNPVEVVGGPPGPSAYDIAVAGGFVGSEAEWLASLKGDGSAWDQITGKPAEVTELAARLAALEYDTKFRSLTLPTGITSGALLVRRERDYVTVLFEEIATVDDPANSFTQWANLIPFGFRPARPWAWDPAAQRATNYSPGPVRVSNSGGLVVYNNDGRLVNATLGYYTADTRPNLATLPGATT